jgi:anti-sigma B factor antagonist
MTGDDVVTENGPATTFRVESSALGKDAFLVELEGEADLYTAPELKQELLHVIDNGARAIVVDLTRASFIDSTTLGVLLGGLKRLRSGGGRMVIVCGDRNIRKIFEITLLDRVFPIAETREEAIARIGDPQPGAES